MTAADVRALAEPRTKTPAMRRDVLKQENGLYGIRNPQAKVD
jgi:hypothetical protein